VLIQKLSISIVSEDQSIGGAEKFMSPVASDELTLGYFLSRAFGDYVVDLGVRNDWVERSGSVTESHDEDDGDHDHGASDHDEEVEYFKTDESITSFGLQIGRRFTDQVTTTLNLSSVEKAPAVVELFMNGAHLATGRNEVGDPNLRTERAKNVEFTMDYDSDALFASLAVYENQIDNYIYLQDTAATEDGLIVAAYQQQDAEFRGYELEFGGNIELNGGVLTLSYGLDNVSAEFSDNSNVPRINPSRSIYSASYAKDLWDLSLVFKDVDSQKDTAMFEDATDSYSMLDFRVSNRIQLSSDLALNVSVFGSNLLDEAARNHSSFVKNQVPQPGRSYGVKVSATF
jgi:iron complex outermembrane receptor protein